MLGRTGNNSRDDTLDCMEMGSAGSASLPSAGPPFMLNLHRGGTAKTRPCDTSREVCGAILPHQPRSRPQLGAGRRNPCLPLSSGAFFVDWRSQRVSEARNCAASPTPATQACHARMAGRAMYHFHHAPRPNPQSGALQSPLLMAGVRYGRRPRVRGLHLRNTIDACVKVALRSFC